MGEAGSPDIAERLTEWWHLWSRRYPVAARRLRLTWCVWSWAALILGLLTLVFVPSTRRGLVVPVMLYYALVQLWLICRSKTISWRAYMWAFTVGSLVAPLIALVDVAAMGVFGLDAQEASAQVLVAGPVEETLKIAPLLVLVVWLAPQRSRRFAVVDHALLAMAFGAGFQLVEDLIRRVAASRGLLAVLQPRSAAQFDLWSLLPGWSEIGPARFPGHFVTTALVGAGVGLALRLRRRVGQRIWALPAGLLVLQVLDHSLYNAYAGVGGPSAPRWLLRLHQLWGGGRESVVVLLLLLVAGMVLDYGALRAVARLVPPLPGSSPLSRAPATVRDAAHDVAVVVAGARAGSGVWFESMAFVRDRRRLGMAAWVAPTDRRRVLGVAPGLRHRQVRLAAALTATAIVVLVLMTSHPGGGQEFAFLANLFDDLGVWWNGLPLWQQALVVGGAAALLTGVGAGWALAFDLALGAGSIAAYGQGIAAFVRDPRRATREFVRKLTPQQALALAAGVVLSRVLPSAVGRLLNRHGTAARLAADELTGLADDLVPGGGLAAHEAAGGHVLARHVGKTERELLDRLVTDPKVRAASSFYDRATAERAVARAIEANADEIQAWLVEPSRGDLLFETALDWDVGRFIPKGATHAVPVQGVRILLRRAASDLGGYYIHTGYPIP